jgi:hypothetical protein
MREGWPSRPPQAPVWRFAAYGLIFALPAIAAALMFLLQPAGIRTASAGR